MMQFDFIAELINYILQLLVSAYTGCVLLTVIKEDCDPSALNLLHFLYLKN